MTKFTVTLAADVRAYALLDIEAADEDAAMKRAKEIARALNNGVASEIRELSFELPVFETEYDTLSNCEWIDIQEARS
jgi:hypothetical protein